jgi:putative FmdB family regulatory protein
MPIYEFKCRKCGADFEELTTLTEVESGEVRCSECGSEQVERQVSTFASGGNAPTSSTPSGSCGSSGFG